MRLKKEYRPWVPGAELEHGKCLDFVGSSVRLGHSLPRVVEGTCKMPLAKR